MAQVKLAASHVDVKLDTTVPMMVACFVCNTHSVDQEVGSFLEVFNTHTYCTVDPILLFLMVIVYDILTFLKLNSKRALLIDD